MDATTYVPVGNNTEVALLRFLQDADVPVHHLIQRKLKRIRATSPFSSEKKYSAVALECPDKQGKIAIYLKGAPEVVLDQCHQTLSSTGLNQLTDPERKNITDKVNTMAGQPLRVMAFAYVEMDAQEW